MRIFNSDGSEAEMCGNGIRCVGKYVYDNGLTNKQEISIETLSGIKYLKLLCDNDGNCNNICVNMGEPLFKDEDLPTFIDEKITKDLKLNIDDVLFRFTLISMGNPHAITFVDNVDDIPIEKYGPLIENDGIFPNRINIEFVEIQDKRNIKVRVWERGAGETLACGTGACAAVVAGCVNGYLENEVTVKLLGGELNIKWGKDSCVFMTGTADIVFEGEILESTNTFTNGENRRKTEIQKTKINNNFLKLQDNYLFSTVAKKVKDYQEHEGHKDKKIIRLGIGDVTLPIPNVITTAIQNATEEMKNKETFKGYGPEQGYEFLRKKITENDYHKKGIDISIDEIFVSDGSKCDAGNISEIFDIDNIVAISDPVYPVYLDTNVMAGRSGIYNTLTGKYENIVYLKANENNNFMPRPSELLRNVNIIYLCSPNNPTGIAMTKDVLKEWVDYAINHNAIILYDAAYEAFIQENNVPHSIYEIENAKKVAIEFKSFSKTAGFTGLRCAYTVIPKELYIGGISIRKLWKRRVNTKFNGVSYIIQKGAEAIYSEDGQKNIKQNILYYRENAKIIKKGLESMNFKVFGGVNAPYIWLKTPNNMKSWDFFDMLLQKKYIVGTPGIGFGPGGEGYLRLTAFGDREDIIEAVNRIKTME